MSMIMTKDGWQPLQVVCVNHNDIHRCFKNTSVSQAQAETGARASAFCKLLIKGDMLAIKSFNPPMFGAYGEKL